MANKEIKTRIQNKRDTAANWEAVATTFQPLDGELIIVDTSAGKTRFKVGRYDTAKGRLLYYNEIPFTDEYLYNELNESQGKIYNKFTNVVSIEAQTLTDAQKAQARENIGAENEILQVSMTYMYGSNYFAKKTAKEIFDAYNSGKKVYLDNYPLINAESNTVDGETKYSFEAVGLRYVDYMSNKKKIQLFGYKATNISADATKFYTTINMEDFPLDGFYMESNPIMDMQIATKKYVDDGIAGKADSSHNHSASDITSGTLPITRGGTNASTAAAARTNLGFSYGTSVPTSAPATGNGAVFFCQDSGSPLSIANGGTGGATQDAARTNLGLPTQDNRIVTICNGTRLVSGSNITITLDPTEAKKYRAILILLGTPLGGNYGNMYDSFIFPLNPDTWSFRFFKYTQEGQDWQCAKANLSSDWTTFTITAVSGSTNHPCWCYLM